MRRLLVALVVLAGLLLIADRGLAALAHRTVAAEVQAAAGLPAEPDVDLGGFPFLPEAVAGRYDRVEVGARDVPAGEIVLDRLDAVLLGAQVPLGEAVSGSVTRVPVEQVTARALVGYDQLEQQAADRELSFAPDAGRLRVTGTVEIFGQELVAVAVSRLEIVDGDLLVIAESFEVGSDLADSLLSGALEGRFDLRVPVQDLPYGLTMTDVDVAADGVVVLAEASNTVLEVPPAP
ncbi:hypothetical protein BH24ACT10_BH24ACT10_19710 [soil metagenome]